MSSPKITVTIDRDTASVAVVRDDTLACGVGFVSGRTVAASLLASLDAMAGGRDWLSWKSDVVTIAGEASITARSVRTMLRTAAAVSQKPRN